MGMVKVILPDVCSELDSDLGAFFALLEHLWCRDGRRFFGIGFIVKVLGAITRR